MTSEEWDLYFESKMDSNWDMRWVSVFIQTLLGFVIGCLLSQLPGIPTNWTLPISMTIALYSGIKEFLLVRRVGKKRRARQIYLEEILASKSEVVTKEVEHEQEINAPVYEEYQFFFNKPKQQ